LAEERRQAEEQRKAELEMQRDEAKRKAEEAERKAREERLAAERRRAEEKWKAELKTQRRNEKLRGRRKSDWPKRKQHAREAKGWCHRKIESLREFRLEFQREDTAQWDIQQRYGSNWVREEYGMVCSSQRCSLAHFSIIDAVHRYCDPPK